MINVVWVCGHGQEGLTGAEQRPACPRCGETTLASVDAPAPSFRGHVRGPHAQFEALPAKAVSFTTEKNNG